MKNVVVTIIAALGLVIAMATVAFGAQTYDFASPSMMSAIPDSLSRAVLQVVQSGDVAGVQTLPSTSTGGSDGMALTALALGAILGGLALIRKAVTER